MRTLGSIGLSSLPTATGGIARLASARIRESGVRLAPLLSKAGLTAAEIDNRGIRLTVQSQIKFLSLAADALQDDFLGFHLARDFNLREVGLFYYVLASSETLAEALHRVERYSGIVNEGISLQLRVRNETRVIFSYVDVLRQSDRHQIEFWITALVRMCRQLTNCRLVPSRIRVVHHRGRTTSELSSFFGCEVEFGANADEVVFNESVKPMPIVSADPYLNKLLTRYCDDARAQRKVGRSTLRPSLENAIAPLLPHGKARAGEIARQLGMSQRTLVRRLLSEGLTFSGVLDELKTDLAKHYLKDQDMAISEIAWLLGYREVSAFTHAFKRWTGKTPRQARAQGDLS